jgi:hypothetical protein
VNEGMMINHSLRELTEDIKGVLRNSILIGNEKGKYLPIFYDKQISSSYRDKYVEDDAFSVFNTEKSRYETKGKVMEIIKTDFKMDVDKLNFCIVNIINTTDSQGTEVVGGNKKTKNNPPTPPYINIANLIYHLPQSKGGMKEKFNMENIKAEYEKIRTRLNKFEFYRNSSIYNTIIKSFNMREEKTESNILNAVDVLVNLVKANNPSTLIGSIETLEMLQSNIKFLCDSNKVEYDKITFHGVQPSEDKFKLTEFSS